MSIYTGYKCPVCDQVFAAGDDVVVCPECGTPHHRACYQKTGHCANEEGHASGKQWEPRREEAAAPHDGVHPDAGSGVVVCGRCGSDNPPGSVNCQVCGYRLEAQDEQNPYRPAYHQPPQGPGYSQYGQGQASGGWQAGPQQQGAYRPGSPYPFVMPQVDLMEEIVSEITAKEICDYVGPNNLTFLYKFKAMAKMGSSVSVNWCGFLGFFYCFYRKMYKLGAIYLAAFMAVMVPSLVVASQYMAEVIEKTGGFTLEAPMVVTPGYVKVAIASFVLWGVMILSAIINTLTFNRLYMKHCFRNIHEIKTNGRFSTGSSDYVFALARRGGVNLNAVLITMAGLFLGNNLISFILSIFAK